MNQFNIKFMKEAIKQAKKAADIGETPIGAVIVRNDKIIARGHNLRETKKNSLCHAEIIAIGKASRKLGGWRLPGCDMYITLEPCAMCSGAILSARIEKVYFGAYDKKTGCAGSVVNLFEPNLFNHTTAIEGGIMEYECSKLLKDFFRALREEKHGS
ncbi:MAG: tRNA adenosine(34) deaminase TadA [Clostridia bacterium]|nr:tRNA adenosine(34) deaminase TadA [Clostridia bacterium]